MEALAQPASLYIYQGLIASKGSVAVFKGQVLSSTAKIDILFKDLKELPEDLQAEINASTDETFIKTRFLPRNTQTGETWGENFIFPDVTHIQYRYLSSKTHEYLLPALKSLTKIHFPKLKS